MVEAIPATGLVGWKRKIELFRPKGRDLSIYPPPQVSSKTPPRLCASARGSPDPDGKARLGEIGYLLEQPFALGWYAWTEGLVARGKHRYRWKPWFGVEDTQLSPEHVALADRLGEKAARGELSVFAGT